MIVARKDNYGNPVFVGNPGFSLDLMNKELKGSLYTIPLTIYLNKKSYLEEDLLYDKDKQRVINLPKKISTEENRLYLSGYITALLTNK